MNTGSYLGGRYPGTVRWTSLLNTDGWEIINEGENGRSIPRSDCEINAVVQLLRYSNAETFVVMLGSNNLLRQPALSAGACAKRMEVFLVALLKQIMKPIEIV